MSRDELFHADDRIVYEQKDISYNADERWGFGYRAAAAIVRDGRLLLQAPRGRDEWALPGGQVMFGETAAMAIAREFLEETGVEVEVGELQATAEVFFPVGERRIHQLFLQFEGKAPADAFTADETPGVELGRNGLPKLRFRWVPLSQLRDIPLYPPQIADVLLDGARHYIYNE